MKRRSHDPVGFHATAEPTPPKRLFEPEDVMWRVNREAVLLFAGPRALLMQLAHPLIAMGVFRYSGFREDPLARLRRTLDAMLGIVYGSRSMADRWGDHLAAIHARVRGETPRDLARLPAATPYSGLDPELLLWVHATLLDSARLAYESFVRPLSPSERTRFYAESLRMAPLFRIPEDSLPPDVTAFETWMSDRAASGALEVTDEARSLARDVLRPRLGIPLGFAGAPLRWITAGLLPPDLRGAYELSWSPSHERAFIALRSLIRSGRRLLPDRLRTFRAARRPAEPPEART